MLIYGHQKPCVTVLIAALFKIGTIQEWLNSINRIMAESHKYNNEQISLTQKNQCIKVKNKTKQQNQSVIITFWKRVRQWLLGSVRGLPDAGDSLLSGLHKLQGCVHSGIVHQAVSWEYVPFPVFVLYFSFIKSIPI